MPFISQWKIQYSLQDFTPKGLRNSICRDTTCIVRSLVGLRRSCILLAAQIWLIHIWGTRQIACCAILSTHASMCHCGTIWGRICFLLGDALGDHSQGLLATLGLFVLILMVVMSHRGCGALPITWCDYRGGRSVAYSGRGRWVSTPLIEWVAIRTSWWSTPILSGRSHNCAWLWFCLKKSGLV